MFTVYLIQCIHVCTVYLIQCIHVCTVYLIQCIHVCTVYLIQCIHVCTRHFHVITRHFYFIHFDPRVDRGQDFRPRPRPRKIQLVKTEAEDNRGFFFLTEAEECKF